MTEQKQLVWCIQSLAEGRGIPTHRKLYQYMKAQHDTVEVSQYTAKAIWENTIRAVSVETIRRLCVVFDVSPPAVFRWSDEPIRPWQEKAQEPPYLGWRVKELAEAHGFDKVSLARQAHIFYRLRDTSKPTMIDSLWNGDHQFVTIAVLSRLVATLDVDTGTLFAWQGEQK